MRRYDRYKKPSGFRNFLVIILIVGILGGVVYLSREAPPVQEKVVKAIDTARFIKP